MTNPTRKQRQLNTHQAILQTTLDLIDEKGLEKLSLREIARRVGYSPAGLYEYFDGKDDILRTLAWEGSSKLIEAFQRLDEGLPPREFLIQVSLAYVRFMIRNPAYTTLMNHIPSDRTSLNEPAPEGSPYTFILEAVRSLLDTGEIQQRDDLTDEVITYSLWAMVHGMGMLRLTQLREFDADFDLANRRALGAFLDGLA